MAHLLWSGVFQKFYVNFFFTKGGKSTNLKQILVGKKVFSSSIIIYFIQQNSLDRVVLCYTLYIIINTTISECPTGIPKPFCIEIPLCAKLDLPSREIPGNILCHQNRWLNIANFGWPGDTSQKIYS